MKRSPRVEIAVGTKRLYDGDMVEVVEIASLEGQSTVLVKEIRRNVLRRVGVNEFVAADMSEALTEDLTVEAFTCEQDPAAVRWEAAPEEARAQARQRAAHVREVLTGYRTGSAVTAQKGEPRAAYRPELPTTLRVSAKSRELRCSTRTLRRWISEYRRFGEAGLLSAKWAPLSFKPNKFQLFEDTALQIMMEHAESSRPTQHHIIAHTRARIVATYGPDAVQLPSKTTAYEILSALERRHPIFRGSTKRNRENAARALDAYGKMLPTRPGEYVLMDTTPLDVFAMDPQTLRWVKVELTVAMDWYSRCITGLRLTPVSTKAIDAASVLYQCIRPAPAGPNWTDAAVWPHQGIPRHVLVEHQALHADTVFAATPAVVPETIVVDHGKIFVGATLTSACRYMGISIQPAQLRRGQDKGPVERFFRTIRESFLQELRGYKGPDVYSRGKSPELEAFFYLDELEALLREWVACVYHRRPHDGVGEPGLWALRMSPAQMFDHGIAKAGYLEIPRDPDLAYHFLDVHWRTVQHYGVEYDKRIYRSRILLDYVNTRSPYTEHNGHWPIHVNPDDIRQVYFFDLKNTRRWYPLTWTEASLLNAPMSEDGLADARQQAKACYREFDDKLALTALLERRSLGQGRSPAERRADLRTHRAKSTLEEDLTPPINVTALPTAHRILLGLDPTTEAIDQKAHFDDDLDDLAPTESGGAYTDTLEDL